MKHKETSGVISLLSGDFSGRYKGNDNSELKEIREITPSSWEVAGQHRVFVSFNQ